MYSNHDHVQDGGGSRPDPQQGLKAPEMPIGRLARRVTRTHYKGMLTAWANISGAASLARGELTLSLSPYESIDLADLPVLLADAGHSAEKIHIRMEERKKNQADQCRAPSSE
jgi:hypothetical protein